MCSFYWIFTGAATWIYLATIYHSSTLKGLGIFKPVTFFKWETFLNSSIVVLLLHCSLIFENQVESFTNWNCSEFFNWKLHFNFKIPKVFLKWSRDILHAHHKKFDFQKKMVSSSLKRNANFVYQDGLSKPIFIFRNFELHTFLTLIFIGSD